jgi:hypothetical protein
MAGAYTAVNVKKSRDFGVAHELATQQTIMLLFNNYSISDP